MNAYPYNENSKTPLFFAILVVLAGLMMIYWVLNIGNMFSMPALFSYSPGPAAHSELATPAGQPAPLPVPTPSAVQSQAPAAPLSTPAAPVVPQAQPVPTPPANP